MSRRGNCWDNAKIESFFSHYKTESINLYKKRIKSFKDIKEITEDYIKFYRFYNKCWGGKNHSDIYLRKNTEHWVSLY